MPVWILNIAYFLMLVALAIRSILSLRIVLVSAQTIFIIYGLLSSNYVLLFWNSVFLAINAVQVGILLRQRQPIEVPADVAEIYQMHFSSLTPREFVYFWQMAKHETVEKQETIIRIDERQERLLLILEGNARVMSGRRAIATLGRGDFVAEMSYLSGQGATADVRTVPGLHYAYWDRKNIDAVRKLNPKLGGKIDTLLTKHLVDKLRETNRALGQEP